MKKKRKASSQRWLQRRQNDPFVQKAKKEGWRARSAYKLMEIEEKHRFLKKSRLVLELGSAPGGWTEVIRFLSPESAVIAVDRLPMDPVEGVTVVQADLETQEGMAEVAHAINGRLVDVVLSDAAPNTIGHPSTDHIRIMQLVEKIWLFCQEVLKKDGTFVCKGWHGHEWDLFVKRLKSNFKKTFIMKPQSSQKESREIFFIGSGFSPLCNNES